MESLLRQTLKDGQFGEISTTRSRTMRAIKATGNKTTEGRLRMALVGAGVKGFVLHPGDITGRPDFYFRTARLAIFVDGCFWHGCPKCGHIPKTRSEFWRMKIARNQQRDQRAVRLLKDQGIKSLRFWECSLRRPALAVQAVKKCIK
jgi:DNA mismatch endonuclease, patch repair protein